MNTENIEFLGAKALEEVLTPLICASGFSAGSCLRRLQR